MKGFLAYVLPVERGQGGRPEHPIAPPEAPVDPGYGLPIERPEHPIVIPPDAIGPGVPSHPIYLPVYPDHPIVIPPNAIGPGVPTHPIVLPPYRPEHPIVIPPGAVSPGVPAHPIVIPGVPSHPIVVPPGIWPDPPEGQAPAPEHPIAIPPPAGSPPGTPPIEIYPVWTPEDGWALVIVPGGSRPAPAPSTARRG